MKQILFKSDDVQINLDVRDHEEKRNYIVISISQSYPPKEISTVMQNIIQMSTYITNDLSFKKKVYVGYDKQILEFLMPATSFQKTKQVNLLIECMKRYFLIPKN